MLFRSPRTPPTTPPTIAATFVVVSAAVAFPIVGKGGSETDGRRDLSGGADGDGNDKDGNDRDGNETLGRDNDEGNETLGRGRDEGNESVDGVSVGSKLVSEGRESVGRESDGSGTDRDDMVGGPGSDCSITLNGVDRQIET